MKPTTMATPFLVLCVCVNSLASVEVIGIQPSAQKARITVLLDGKPQRGVRLTVATADGQPKVSLVTDSHGLVRLPALPSGNYCVTASVAPPLRRSGICLAIPSHRGKKKFSMVLVLAPPPPPTFDEKLQAAERAHPAERVNQLAGVVTDALGAVIANAQVEIMPCGSRDFADARKTATDHAGRFTYPLEPGSYTVIFQAPGFETKILVFDVAPDARKSHVVVKMEVGAITE
jgi:Carboxypeptidase regulatory-like domain